MGNDGEGISDKSDELTPRQMEFLRHYLDPKSETYSNAYQSALKAGYGPKYANQITAIGNEWLREITSDNEMLKKAEENLKKAMEIPVDDKDMGQRSLDASKFTAERLGKRKWSTKSEVEFKGQVELKTIDEFVRQLADS